VAVELALNTFLGEELLFRGLLLPRMGQAFGRADWLVNALLFGFYHLHEPWVIPNAAVTGALCAYPTRRYRSAWMGIAIHSVEAVFFLVVLFPIVMS
jgi:membrane protease YdiL (CAAX protease family)